MKCYNNKMRAVDPADPVRALVHKAKRGGLFGIPTGFKKMDYILGGWEPSRMYAIGGYPGDGKTALGIYMALAAARDGQRATITSIEMSLSQVLERLVCQAALVSGSRTDPYMHDEEQALVNAWEEVQSLPIEIFDVPRCSVETVAECIEHSRPRLLILDHFQQMHHARTTEAYTAASRDLLTLCRESEVPFIVLAQLNRELEKLTRAKGEEIPPKLSDFKDCSALAEDSHAAMILRRPDNAREEANQPMRDDLMHVHIIKQRSGPKGRVSLPFRNGMMVPAEYDSTKPGSGIYGQIKGEVEASHRLAGKLES